MMRRFNNKAHSYLYKFAKMRQARFNYDSAALRAEGYYSQCGQGLFERIFEFPPIVPSWCSRLPEWVVRQIKPHFF